MKTLYLLRHAHTVSAAPPMLGDHERALSPQGVREAAALGAFMRENALLPDFVISSSAVRTVMTAKLVLEAGGMNPRSHFDRRLYQAPADRLIEEIRAIDDSIGKLMLVSHNPGVAELAMALGRVESYAPGTLSVFHAEGQSWGDFSPDAVKLEKVFVPPSQ